MEQIRKFFQEDRFAHSVGIELLEASFGRAKAKLEIREHHLNALNTVHGAAIYALADMVGGIAANSNGNSAVALNSNISFLKAVSKGVLFAEATEISSNHKLSSYIIRVTDEKDDLIAIVQALAYKKKDAAQSE
ncbi:MAG: PaaI family thioesterase [Syntrophobacteraceae bacterium]|jgi:acyl-CoA thioesterase